MRELALKKKKKSQKTWTKMIKKRDRAHLEFASRKNNFLEIFLFLRYHFKVLNHSIRWLVTIEDFYQ